MLGQGKSIFHLGLPVKLSFAKCDCKQGRIVSSLKPPPLMLLWFDCIAPELLSLYGPAGTHEKRETVAATSQPRHALKLMQEPKKTTASSD